LTCRPIQTLVHDNISLSDVLHEIISHLQYKALPTLQNMVIGFLELPIEHDGICRGSALGMNVKETFIGNENKSKGILNLIHSNVCG